MGQTRSGTVSTSKGLLKTFRRNSLDVRKTRGPHVYPTYTTDVTTHTQPLVPPLWLCVSGTTFLSCVDSAQTSDDTRVLPTSWSRSRALTLLLSTGDGPQSPETGPDRDAEGERPRVPCRRRTPGTQPLRTPSPPPVRGTPYEERAPTDLHSEPTAVSSRSSSRKVVPEETVPRPPPRSVREV